MNNYSLISLTEQNIRQAIADYGKHTDSTEVLDDVSDDFIRKLAHDSVVAKTDLRNLFQSSPAWDENLQALVINGTRTHNSDFNIISDLAQDIFRPHIYQFSEEVKSRLFDAIKYFTIPNGDRAVYIAAINAIAPKAYSPNKKPSRIFKAICDSLGVTDNTAGSNFQKLFAKFADELSSRKIDFKLFISINPAHFLTMSNPKNDERGTMLTSCHSLNSTDYSYNCGCTGYARDNVTFIAFTVADPSDAETLNNRKISRQLFMYQPNNGLLLQSRLYNTYGGTCGVQEDSKLYRDLIQREISALEGVPNLWKTYPYVDNKLGCSIHSGEGFGGYTDWTYSNFNAKISIRCDHEHDFKTFTVGTYGLCVVCGKETSQGVYCESCNDAYESEFCDECEENCSSLTGVYNSNGDYIHVCGNCLSEWYRRCDDCDEYHHIDNITFIDDCTAVCQDCLENNYFHCSCCDDYYPNHQRYIAVDCDGCEMEICNICREENYVECEDCGRYVHFDDSYTAYNSEGKKLTICPACRDSDYSYCTDCEKLFHEPALVDGLCADCRDAKGETA